MITLSKKYYVYVLKHPVTKRIFYVGKTKNPEVRFKDHLRSRANKAKYKYIKNLKKPPIMELLVSFDSEVKALNREEFYIRKFTKNGYKLLNGGNGAVGDELSDKSVMLRLDVYEMAQRAAEKRLISVHKLVELAVLKYYS